MWSGSYEVTWQTILQDIAEVVAILAVISLSLAVVNLFPFLPWTAATSSGPGGEGPRQARLLLPRWRNRASSASCS